MRERVATPTRRDDRLMATTRWVAAVVVPVLVAAFVILYLFPGRTMQLWSWMICPKMSAVFIGAGYLSGAYLFTRVATGRRWHPVSAGIVATTVFSSLLLAATLLHWNSFNHGHVSFWAWLALYATTPVLLPVLWVKNRRRDPRTPQPGDVTVPRPLRIAVGTGGAVQLAFALVMFLWPDLVAEVWPWGLDALTARTLSAFVAFPAVTWLLFLFDGRWSSFRVTQHMVTMALALITLAAIRFGGDFTKEAAQSVYVSGLVVALALNVALYAAIERRTRSQRSRHLHLEEEWNHAPATTYPPDVASAGDPGRERIADRARRPAGVGQA